jgi:hypothetical protein
MSISNMLDIIKLASTGLSEMTFYSSSSGGLRMQMNGGLGTFNISVEGGAAAVVLQSYK